MSSGVCVVRLAPGEGPRLKRLRLAALHADPHAFCTTLVEARTWVDAAWEEQVRTLATFVATGAGGDLGLARGAPATDATDAPAAAYLLSMWVAPPGRRRGVGTRLVGAVVDWARAAGFGRLLLDVGEANLPARALYAALGFTETGHAWFLPAPRADRRELRMALPLAGRA